MSKSTIQWTDETWNPTTGCNKVSQGCKFCYAEKQHFRLQHMHPKKYTKGFSEGVEVHEDTLLIPLSWKKPRKVFVNSMSDLFHNDVPFEFIAKVFAVAAVTPQHTYQILTKRPERMLEFFNWFESESLKYSARAKRSCPYEDDQKNVMLKHLSGIDVCKEERQYPLSNVWLGTSCEDEQTANERIPHLLQVPAAVRFLSCEPLLGKIDLTDIVFHGFLMNVLTGEWDAPATNFAGKIDWVITGGESGSKARPAGANWIRSLRDQCKVAEVPFFFKQWGEYGFYGHGNFPNIPLDTDEEYKDVLVQVGKKASGRLLDGKEHNEFPKDN